MIGIGQNDFKLQPSVLAYSSGASLEFDFTSGSAHPIEGNAALVVTRPLDTATAFNPAGVLEVCAANTARLQHDPSVLEFENMLLWSEAFDNAAWSKGNSTISPNAAIGWRGALTADKLTEDTATTQHLLTQSIGAAVAGATYTISVYAKAGERTKMSLTANGEGYSVFDLSAGTVTQTGGNVCTIEAKGGGWYRCSASITKTNTNGSFYILTWATTNNYTGDGASGLYIDRAQLNTGSTALEYQRTGATAFAKWYACKGLLVEDARQNSFTRSAEFDHTDWGKIRSSISANAASSLDGSTSADKLVEDSTASSDHYTRQPFSFTSGTTYTFSAYVKAAERQDIVLWLEASTFGATQAVRFNLSTGIATTITGSPVATISVVKDGWYRVTSTSTATATVLSNCILMLHNGTGTSYTGDGASGLYIWGAQLEAGASASSYIPTTSAAVTRNADSPDVAIGPWYSQTEGRILVEYSQSSQAPGARALSLDDGSITNVMHFTQGQSSPDDHRFDVLVGSVAQAQLIYTSTGLVDTTYKAIAAYKSNDIAGSENGAAVLTDTAATIPTVTTMRIGYGPGSARINGTIKRVAYWRSHGQNADLPQMST